jgi:hypothetical protein
VTQPPWYLAALDALNPVLVALLRSRLSWPLSVGLMAVTVTGRRSGRRYTIPVGHHDVGDAIVVLVSDAAHRQWWRNFHGGAAATLWLHGRAVAAEGTVVPPASLEFRRRAEQAFRRAGFIARIFGIAFDPRVGLTDAQHDALAAYAAIVVFRPTGAEHPFGREES